MMDIKNRWTTVSSLRGDDSAVEDLFHEFGLTSRACRALRRMAYVGFLRRLGRSIVEALRKLRNLNVNKSLTIWRHF
jgi:hypothetical protein